MSVRLIDKATGAETYVEEADLPNALASNKYIQPQAVAARRFGEDTYVTPDQLKNEAGATVAVDPAQVALARGHKIREDANTGVVATAKATLGGAVDMASLGLVKPFEEEQEFNRGAAIAGNVLGLGASLLLPGPEAAVGKLFGEGAEAAQVSAGARELATTGDALAAEHVASTLSSKALLGGAGELNAGERALARSGRALDEATVARSGLRDVPADLMGLDDAGLREASNAEKLALKTQAGEERASLEELRKPQREELVNDIRDMHQELQEERPIFKAAAGADVRAVDGMKDVASQLNKSYRGLRGKLDNPLRAAESPDLLLGDLQMRQTALETLQAKAPELRALLGDDARAAALEHVDGALEQTKQQIDRIKALNSRTTPVASSRLTSLEAGVSPRLNAIDAAREALKVAPEVGLAQKGLKAGVFAAGTALAHAIPGVGILAPFAGKWASEAIGRTFEHLAAAKAGAVALSGKALESFLSTAKAAAPRVVNTATQVLARASFGASTSEAKTGDGLADLYKARAGELRQQTMYAPDGSTVVRPEVRQGIAQRLAPIAQVNPRLADQLETIAVRKLEYLSTVMPRRPDIGGLQIGPDRYKPDDLTIRSWARSVRAVEDPHSVELDLAHGIVTPEAAKAYRAVYPERFLAMQTAIFHAAPALSKSLPMKKKIALSVFTGIPCTPAMTPNVIAVLQASFAMEPGSAGGTQAPRPLPQFGAFGSTPSVDKTAAQRSEEP